MRFPKCWSPLAMIFAHVKAINHSDTQKSQNSISLFVSHFFSVNFHSVWYQIVNKKQKLANYFAGFSSVWQTQSLGSRKQLYLNDRWVLKVQCTKFKMSSAPWLSFFKWENTWRQGADLRFFRVSRFSKKIENFVELFLGRSNWFSENWSNWLPNYWKKRPKEAFLGSCWKTLTKKFLPSNKYILSSKASVENGLANNGYLKKYKGGGTLWAGMVSNPP